MTNLEEWIKRVEDLTHERMTRKDPPCIGQLRGNASGTYEAWYVLNIMPLFCIKEKEKFILDMK